MNNPVLGYLLIVAGGVLLAAELFIPSLGILPAVGIGAVIAGLAMLFTYDPTHGFITLLALFVLVPIVVPVLLNLWRKSAVGRSLVLEGPDDDASVANMPVNLELEELRGKYGKAVSPLRPSGVTDFDGRRVDTLSEGPLVEAGQWVRCVDVRAGKVIVRPVDRPPTLEDELNFDDLNLG